MPYYHVRITQKSYKWNDEVKLDNSLEDLEQRILEPYRNGRPITIGGKAIALDDIERVRITKTVQDSTCLRPIAEQEQRGSMIIPPISVEWYIADMGEDVTDEFITGPPGYGPEQRLNNPQGSQTWDSLFDQLITNTSIREASGELYLDGHYSSSVEKAFVRLNNEVKEKSGLSHKDGADLMRAAFSANSPILFLNPFQSDSDRNEQRGYMELLAGAMTGIRNPRAHEHDFEDDPEISLELLVLANHLMRRLNGTSKGDSPLGDSTP